MNVYLVNLDKDKERLAAATAQLHRQGVPFERYSAVYAKELPATDVSDAVNHFRWWCAMGRPIKPGEIGCAMSHYNLYQKIVDEHLNAACILEDDVILDSHFSKVCDYVEQWLDPQKPQVVLLSNHTQEHEEQLIIKSARADMYTEGYIITQKAARALLAANRPMQVPCDHWGRWVRMGKIELYHAFPTVCKQKNDVETSSISSVDQFKVSDLPVALWVLHKIKRVIGLAIDGFLIMMGRSA